MSDDETATEALATTLRVARMMEAPSIPWEKTANREIAQNVLHAELGFYSDKQPMYDLDQQTRDRLLVHARQDAANALLNTITLMDEFLRWKRRAKRVRTAVAVIAVISIALVIIAVRIL